MKSIDFMRCQLVRERTVEYTVKGVSDVLQILNQLQFYREPEEVVMLFCLDNKGQVVGMHEVSRGDVSGSFVHPREIFKRALLNNAKAIILAHNHPSDDPTPSEEDIDITNRIKAVGGMMSIPLVDHLIVGSDTESWSARAHGLI